MAETTGAILHRVSGCDMLYKTTAIMSSLSSPKSFPPAQPSRQGADGPGTDAVATDALWLLDQVHERVRERVRYLHNSIRTEEAYVHWVRAFVHFHGLQHPKGMGGEQAKAFPQQSSRHVTTPLRMLVPPWTLKRHP